MNLPEVQRVPIVELLALSASNPWFGFNLTRPPET